MTPVFRHCLEQDPVTQPRCRSCLASELTRLVGVWGPVEGLVSGVPDESVRGLAFLSSKPWLVIARLARERSGQGDALRAVDVPSGFEVPVPYFPEDVATTGRHRGCRSLDIDERDQLLAAMSDGTVRVLDGPTGEERRRFDIAAEVIAYAGPGQFVAATATGLGRYDLPSGTATAAIHDIATGAKVVSLPIRADEKYLNGMSSDASGNRIVLGITRAGGGSSVRCVNRAGTILWESPIEGSFSTSVGPVAISRDGGIVAVAAWMGKLQFFDGETGAFQSDLKESRNCSSPVFSRDGAHLALSLHSRAVAIAETAGKVTGDRDDGASDVFAFSADGTLIASEGREGSVRLSSVPDAKPVAAARGFERGFALDATRIVIADAGENAFLITDHEGAVSKRVPRSADQERILAITPDGGLVVQPARFKQGPVVRLDASGTTTLFEAPYLHEFFATTACKPPRVIALGIADATLVDVVTGARTELAGAHDPEWGSGDDTGDHDVTACAISPDATLAATSSSDATIAMWSLPAGKLRHQFTVMYKDESVRSRADALAFSRDGALLFAVVAVNYGPRLYAYDVATHKLRYEINRKDAPMVATAPAVAEHRRLVAFATEDGVLLCHPEDGRVLDRIRIGDQPAALAFAEPHLFVQTSRGQILRFRLS